MSVFGSYKPFYHGAMDVVATLDALADLGPLEHGRVSVSSGSFLLFTWDRRPFLAVQTSERPLLISLCHRQPDKDIHDNYGHLTLHGIERVQHASNDDEKKNH